MQGKDRPKKGRRSELKVAQQRGLSIPPPPAGVVYRNLGTMEHHICDIIAQRMKNRKASWSKSGAEKLSKILTLKAAKRLYEKVSSISTVILPETYTEGVQEILSAAKAPKTDGRKAIQGRLSYR